MSMPTRNDDPRFTKSGALYLPAGEGSTTWFSGDVYTTKASRESTSGSLGAVEATVPARNHGLPGCLLRGRPSASQLQRS